jgi:hypothetical protein
MHGQRNEDGHLGVDVVTLFRCFDSPAATLLQLLAFSLSLFEGSTVEKISYRDVTFDVIRTLSCERTRVHDAANNYLHTHWEVTVEVNFQPALASYKLERQDRPISERGHLPGETDLAILSHLLQPRGKLKITAGDSVILETPLAGMPCDLKGGPSVEVVSVPHTMKSAARNSGFSQWHARTWSGWPISSGATCSSPSRALKR